MKKFNKHQAISKQIAHWEKYGIERGIKTMLRNKMRADNLCIDDWEYKYKINEKCAEYKDYRVTFIVPTPQNFSKVLDYPCFIYANDMCYIDMICFDNCGVQIHLMKMCGEPKNQVWVNNLWHCCSEILSLEQMMMLYEYITCRLSDLIILTKENSDKYNITGALFPLLS